MIRALDYESAVDTNTDSQPSTPSERGLDMDNLNDPNNVNANEQQAGQLDDPNAPGRDLQERAARNEQNQNEDPPAAHQDPLLRQVPLNQGYQNYQQ